MMVGGRSYAAAGPGIGRPWTFYALATLFGFFLLFLYGPMLVMYLLSFQGPNGGVTFPMVGFSTVWFQQIVKPGQMANIPVSFGRSVMLASVVSLLTVTFSVAAGVGLPPSVSRFGRAVLSRRRESRHAEPSGRVRHRPRVQGVGMEHRSVHLGA